MHIFYNIIGVAHTIHVYVFTSESCQMSQIRYNHSNILHSSVSRSEKYKNSFIHSKKMLSPEPTYVKHADESVQEFPDQQSGMTKTKVTHCCHDK